MSGPPRKLSATVPAQATMRVRGPASAGLAGALFSSPPGHGHGRRCRRRVPHPWMPLQQREADTGADTRNGDIVWVSGTGWANVC